MNYTDIISGQSKGLKSQGLRILLLLLSFPYRLIVSLRNYAYDLGLLSQKRCGLPVFCVGNITAGGTGKTPMVIWLCRYLQSKGLRVALLSRGYKSKDSTGLNDEMLLLQGALPDVGFFIGSDRYTNAIKASSQGYQVLVMDDGYQHRRLYRNVNILMVDALCPFGYGKILPAGLLRESLTGIKRAQVAVLTRSDTVTPDTIRQIGDKILLFKQMPLLTTSHAPSALFDSKGQEKPLSTLQNQKVTAFCSIGNPKGFIATLEQLGANVIGRYFFDDHSEYDQERAGIIRQLSLDAPEQLLVTTEKDWVKLSQCPNVAGIDRLFWLRIELGIISGEAELKNLIDNTLNMN